MRKLVLTAIAAALSMAVTATYAQDTTKDKPKRTAATTTEPKNVSESNPSGGPTEGKARTPSGKQRKSGPETKSVSDASNPAGGPNDGKARTPSGKQRKQGPDAKGVDENRGGK